MQTNSQSSGGFGWTDEVDPASATDKYTILPDGEALFTILKFERERKDWGKFGTINVAILTLLVKSLVAEATSEIKEQIGLHHDLDWKITQFFTALGQRKTGDTGKFTPDWSRIVGGAGRCMVKARKYAKRDDALGTMTGIANDVDKFLPPIDSEDQQETVSTESEVMPF